MSRVIKSLVVAAAVVLLPACSFGSLFDKPDKSPTISELRDRPIPVIDEQPMAESLELAESSYRQMLELDQMTTMRPEALRRLADILTDVNNIMDDEGELDQRAMQEAIALYEEALEDYPAYRARDEILYQLARLSDQNGDPDQSFEFLNQLIADHPESHYYQEAQFRRGEYLFVEREYAAAQSAYQIVLDEENGNERFIEPAIYKKGWALFKQSEYESSVNAFTEILDQRVSDGAKDLDKLSRTERERIEDSLRAISLCFVYQEGADTALAYFNKHGARKYEDLIYAHLAEYYIDKERYTDGANTYRGFLYRNPWHENAADFQAKVIATLRKGDFPSLELEARKEFVERFDRGAEYWEYYPIAQNEHITDEVKVHVVDLAKHYHAEAQKGGDAEAYAQAEQWYERFLTSFPKDEKAPEMNYLLAESYFQSEQYLKSAEAYEATAYNYGDHEKAAEAGYAALLSYQALQESDAIENAGTAFANSAFRFEENFPQHPKANEVLVSVAQTQFEQRNYEMAMKVAERILEKEPPASDEHRRTVWIIAANTEFERANFDRAEIGYVEALALLAPQDAQRAELSENLAIAVYRQAEAARDAGKTEEAVRHFLRVAERVPASAVAATAQYDAAALYVQKKQWQQAVPILERFRASYPGHELQAEVDKSLATAYLETDQPLKAAAEFERLASTGESPEIRREALLQASDLYADGGQDNRSMSMLEQFVEDHPVPAEPAMEAAAKLAAHHEKLFGAEDGYRWHRKVLELNATVGGAANDRTRYLAAKSTLSLIQPKVDAYRRVALVAPLKQTLRNKRELMEDALDSYAEVSAFGIAEISTEAAYQTGFLYADFAEAIMQSERPANLDADALEEYEILLEEQSDPFIEKAIEAHEVNVRRVSQDVYDDWVKQSLHDLRELMPGRYNKEERLGVVERVH